jgi:ribosomal protein S12 methylthiotransferase accessory factor YcaO
VDSSGVVSWEFLGEQPDHAFADWNFSTTTQEDCDWLCACIAAEGKDVYISDFEELDVYACRILVPGMSDIYPVEDLQWGNNSVGNDQAARVPQAFSGRPSSANRLAASRFKTARSILLVDASGNASTNQTCRGC